MHEVIRQVLLTAADYIAEIYYLWLKRDNDLCAGRACLGWKISGNSPCGNFITEREIILVVLKITLLVSLCLYEVSINVNIETRFSKIES